MCDIGPLLNAQQVTAGPAPDFWQVAFDAGTVFDIEYDAALERVVLSSRVAELRHVRRLEVCELMLRVNFAWRETAGVRMALHSHTDDVVMMFEMPVANLHAAQLSTALANLADKHRAWRQIVLATGIAQRDDALRRQAHPLGVTLA
jgi:hypothetical protein